MIHTGCPSHRHGGAGISAFRPRNPGLPPPVVPSMTTTPAPAPPPPPWTIRALVLVTLLLGVYTLAPTVGRVPPGQTPPPRLADTLPLIPRTDSRVTVPGYQRDQFGAGWGPAHIGPLACTTHDLMLALSLPGATVAPDCTVSASPGQDPYSGSVMSLHPPDRDQRIEVDHIYPLSAAWDMGAAEWDRDTRIRFANDPANLVVVSARENRRKSDSLPSDWLPGDRWSRCWYVRRLAAVARDYRLRLTPTDVATMRRQCLLAVHAPH